MSGLFWRDKNGTEHAIREIEGLSGDTILVFLNYCVRADDAAGMAKRLSECIGRRVVVLDARVSRVAALAE